MLTRGLLDVENPWLDMVLGNHCLADYWDQTNDAVFQVDIQSEVIYYPLAHGLSKEIRKEAKRQGVTPETLLNIWIQERLHEL